jgi:hypothetical protein
MRKGTWLIAGRGRNIHFYDYLKHLRRGSRTRTDRITLKVVDHFFLFCSYPVVFHFHLAHAAMLSHLAQESSAIRCTTLPQLAMTFNFADNFVEKLQVFANKARCKMRDV